ncbi:hypothetical protein MKW98_009943 [Papaver atlanticum]|uniref:Uncharacterized protein n=1 Tax=Papaver atlanticum TaxID=357466 RepID=A0AAD4XPM4_9MAGN|nr:hypothetical protein MKW98_009943 [Papaver atlanticum]
MLGEMIMIEQHLRQTPPSDEIKALLLQTNNGLRWMKIIAEMEGNPPGSEETLEDFKMAVKSTKKLCAVMLDTVGPELQVVNKSERWIALKAESSVVLTPDHDKEATSDLLLGNYDGIAKAVKKGDCNSCVRNLHVEEAQSIGLDHMDVEGLKRLNKNKKLVKKLAKKYHAFLASEVESLESKVNETKAMVKFQLKKVLCMGVAVGNLGMEEKQIFQNVQLSVSFLVSLLKKNWQNVRCLYLKSTMGKVNRVF